MVQVEEHTAADLMPPRPSLNGLRRRAATCTACPLYADATQTVFGDGTLRSIGGYAPRPVAPPSQTGSNGEQQTLLITG
jgi:hypothetical protein